MCSVVAVLLLAGVLHSRSIGRGFFADDYVFLEQVRGRQLTSVLASPDPLGSYLRPLGRQSYFWVVSRLGDESPVAFHATNLFLFLLGVLAFYLLVRSRAGWVPALTAAAFVALHYAADVPLAWASGSQDILAFLFATTAAYLHCTRRYAWAAAALLLALLSKEIVAGAAFVCIVVLHVLGESWRRTIRRGTSLIAVTLAWGVWWIAAMHPHLGGGVSPIRLVSDTAAALTHLVQVALGAEFRVGRLSVGHWGVFALIPAAIAGIVLLLASDWAKRPGLATKAAGSSDLKSSQWLMRVGIAWAVAGTLPIVAAVSQWSAYYFLFALCGVSLVFAAMTMRWPAMARASALAAVVWLSANARGLDEFTTVSGAWTSQSHLNQHYIDRGLTTTDRFLRQLRSARPALPARSTIFFANLPPAVGWQAGNGPFLRWAYRDTSLRSYSIGGFSRERAERGPMFVFGVIGDTMVDRTTEPLIMPGVAYSMILADRPKAATDALNIALERGDPERFSYWRAWTRWAAGDTAGAMADLRRFGFVNVGLPARGGRGGRPAPSLEEREDALVTARYSAPLAADVHGRLSAIWLASAATRQDGVIEAYAFKALAPDTPEAWRIWTLALLAESQHEAALPSLRRYLKLLASGGESDPEAERVLEELESATQGRTTRAPLHARS